MGWKSFISEISLREVVARDMSSYILLRFDNFIINFSVSFNVWVGNTFVSHLLLSFLWDSIIDSEASFYFDYK